jgi:hypothetical protein
LAVVRQVQGAACIIQHLHIHAHAQHQLRGLLLLVAAANPWGAQQPRHTAKSRVLLVALLLLLLTARPGPCPGPVAMLLLLLLLRAQAHAGHRHHTQQAAAIAAT